MQISVDTFISGYCTKFVCAEDVFVLALTIDQDTTVRCALGVTNKSIFCFCRSFAILVSFAPLAFHRAFVIVAIFNKVATRIKAFVVTLAFRSKILWTNLEAIRAFIKMAFVDAVC